MPVFNNALAGAAGSGGAGDYKIERSLRFNRDDDAHLKRTFAAGNRKTWTWSGWIKLGREQTGGSSNRYTLFECTDNFSAAGNPYGLLNIVSGMLGFGEAAGGAYTTAFFRDHSAWYHVVAAMDTTQSTPADRLKLYVNGVQYAHTGYTFGLNADTAINQGGIQHTIGREENSDIFEADLLMADVHFVDGLQLNCTEFGEFDDNGVWNPIEYTGNYNASAVAGTSYSSATGAKSLYSTTNDGQTLGSGYSTGAIPNTTKLIIPGFSLTEGGGTSGSGQSISNSGATTVTSNTKYYGTAVQFATSANQGSHAGNSFSFSQNLGLQGLDFFTLEAWVYPRSGHTHDFVIVFEGDWNNNEGLMFYLDSSRYPKLTLGNGSFQSFTSSQQIPYDKWTHVACVNLNNTISFYVNGNKDTASGTRSKNYTLGNNHRHVGAYRDSNHLAGPRNPFYGYMTDIRVTTDSRYSASFTVPGGGAVPAGVNGFHLDFSNNSTKDTLGDDVAGSNDFGVLNVAVTQPTGKFTVTRAQYTTGVGDQYDPWASLDGDTTTSYADRGYNNNGLSFTGLPQATQSIRILCNIGGGTTTLNANHGSSDVRTFSASSTDTGAWKTISGTISSSSPYTLTKITADGGNNSSSYFSLYAIEIDGVIVVDHRFGSKNDSLIDSPTNYESSSGNNGGNYATLNPLYKQSEVQLTNSNLDVTWSGASGHAAFSTIAMQTGKYYFEITSGGNTSIGIRRTNKTPGNWPGTDGAGYGYAPDGRKVNSGTYYSFGTAHSDGDIIGVAFDADSGKLWFSHNGTWQASGNPAAGSNPAFTVTTDPGYGWYGSVGYWTSPGTNVNSANFGQRPFAFPPPAGFKSLCTTNLSTPLITKSSDHFLVKAYNGNGNTQSITTGFSPDLVWLKSRQNGDHHGLFDTHRGALMRLVSDYSYASTSRANTLTSFNSNGFSLGSSGDYNGANNESHIAWAWEGGDFNNTFNYSSYDQSQIWSEIATISGGSTASGKQVIYGFDGTITTATEGDSNNEYLEIPISATISAGGVRVYAAVTSSNPLVINLYNGSSNVETVTGSNSGGQWYATSTYSGAITKIRIERTGRAFEFNAVEVNGKILTNAGLISVGGLNTSLYNQTQTWSGGLAGSGSGGYFHSSDPKTQAFDGDMTTRARWTGTADPVLTATLPTAISASTLRVRGHFWKASSTANEDVLISVNGGTYVEPVAAGLTTYAETSAAGGELFLDCSSLITGGQVSSVSVKRRGSTSTATGLTIYAIEVDGKILVDDTQTPANIPSVPSIVRANQTAGFSICSYPATGSDIKIAHGLNSKPSLIILKSTNVTGDWLVMHDKNNPNKFLKLNDPQAEATATNVFLSVDSSTFETGNDSGINSGTQDKLAYVFSEVEGYSRFGQYQSSGNTFVYTGFRPAFVIFKSKVSAHWLMMDAERDPANDMENHLHPNLANAEAVAANRCDFLSNGFKLISNYGETNDGQVYVYFAFAENPFKTARAR